MMFQKQARSRWLAICAVALFLLTAASLFALSTRPVTAAFDLPAQATGAITYGTGVVGNVNPSSPFMVYSFEGTEGDLVDIQAVGLSPNMRPSVALLDTSQNRLAINTNDVFSPITGDASLSHFLPYTGAYLIVVTNANGGGVDFMLRLDGRPAVVSPMLEPNVPVRVELPAGSAPQFFRFEHQTQCFSTLTIIPETADFPFTAHIRTEIGPSVAILRGGALRENRLTVPPDSGTYEVEVGLALPEAEGYVILVLTCAEDAPFCESAADFPPVNTVLPGGRIGETPVPMSTPPANVTPTLPSPGVTPSLPPPPNITQVPTLPLPPPPDVCGGFRITSPTDGLPNGPVTIYWDPAPGAAGYVVIVTNLDNGMSTGTSVGAGTTSATLDVGVGVLGAGFTFRVTVNAIDSFQANICSSSVTLLRESPSIPGDDPDDEPEPFCGDTICNGDETANTCTSDCIGEDAP